LPRFFSKDFYGYSLCPVLLVEDVERDGDVPDILDGPLPHIVGVRREGELGHSGRLQIGGIQAVHAVNKVATGCGPKGIGAAGIRISGQHSLGGNGGGGGGHRVIVGMTSLYRLMLLLLLLMLLRCPLLIDAVPDPEASQIALGAGQSVLLMQQGRVLVLDGQEDEGACNESANKRQTSAKPHWEKNACLVFKKWLKGLLI